MVHRRLKSSLARLSMTHKWLLASSVVLALSTFMPWYQDVDAFGAGDTYLGVTGPLFLVGLMVLGSALFVSAWVLSPSLGRPLPHLPVKEGALYTFLGLQDLLLLLVANSVFFHPKFGVNITLKNTRFGMILAFVGVLVMIWSGYQLYQQERRRGREGVSEPFIKMPESERVARTLEHNEDRERAIEPDEKPAPQPLRMDL